MTAEEIIRRYTAGERDFSGADLRGVDLSKADLCGADLSAADLREADLSGADLNEVNLYGADLSGAKLRGASLRGADLRGARLGKAGPGSDGKVDEVTFTTALVVVALFQAAALPAGTRHD